MKNLLFKIIDNLNRKYPALMENLRTSLNSRLRKGFSLNMLSLVILAVSGFGMNILIVATRGEAALGVFSQVYAVYLIISQIVVFGLHHSVLRMVSYDNKDRDQCSAVTISAMVLITAISVPTTIISIWLIKPMSFLLESPDVIVGLMLTLPSLIFFSLNKVLINTLNGLDELEAFSIFRSMRYILLPLIITLMVAFDVESSYLAGSLSAGEFILFIALSIYIFRKVLPFTWPENFRELAREHLKFGSRGFLSGLLIGINTKVDVLMIGVFLSDVHVGVYSFAATLAEGLYEITVVAQLSLNPEIGKAFSRGDKPAIESLSRKFRKYFSPIMIGIGALSILVFPMVVLMFADSSFLTESWIIFAVIIMGIVVDAGYGAMRGTILLGNRPGLYTLYNLILLVGDALLNLIMIPLMGIVGAGLVTMSTYILSMIYLRWINHKAFLIDL
jgi:O-antigen/teichoic acid export membrane protein